MIDLGKPVTEKIDEQSRLYWQLWIQIDINLVWQLRSQLVRRLLSQLDSQLTESL